MGAVARWYLRRRHVTPRSVRRRYNAAAPRSCYVGWTALNLMKGWAGKTLFDGYHQQCCSVVTGIAHPLALFSTTHKAEMTRKITDATTSLRRVWGSAGVKVGQVLTLKMVDPTGLQDPYDLHIRSKQRLVTEGMGLRDVLTQNVEPFEQHVLSKLDEHNQRSGWVVGSVRKHNLEFSRWEGIGAWVQTPFSVRHPSYGLCNRRPRVEHLSPRQRDLVLQKHNTCLRDSVEAALAAQMLPGPISSHCEEEYRQCGEGLNWRGVKFPSTMLDVARLERQNPGTLGINVYRYNPSASGTPGVYPPRLTERHDARYVINLLLVRDGEREHFIAMSAKSLGAIIYQSRGGRGKTSSAKPCPRCQHCFSGKGAAQRLKEHLTLCRGVNGGAPQIASTPTPCDPSLPPRLRADRVAFKQHAATAKMDYVCFYDLEAYSIPVHGAAGGSKGSWTRDTHHQTANTAVAVITKQGVLWREFLYRGDDDPCGRLLEWIQDREVEISKELERRERCVDKCMTRGDWDAFNAATHCWICREPFAAGEERVPDHDHTGRRFLGAAHTFCNQQRQVQGGGANRGFLPIICHNAAKYDTHHVFQSIERHPKLLRGRKLEVVARNPSTYISWSLGRRRERRTCTLGEDVLRRGYKVFTTLPQFSGRRYADLLEENPPVDGVPLCEWVLKEKPRCDFARYVRDAQGDPDKKVVRQHTVGLKLVFLDSLLFLDTSLDALVQNRVGAASTAEELRKVLPITSSQIDDEGVRMCAQKGSFPYSHVTHKEVFLETCLPPREAFYSELSRESISEEAYERSLKIFKKYCKSLGDYNDWYARLDVLLLADVWHAFANLMGTEVGVWPEHCLTGSQLFWSSMLRKTGAVVDLVVDPTMYQFFESGIRGGITQCHGHCKANEPGLPDYDKTKPFCTLQYEDATSLYQSAAMIHALPHSNYRWMSAEECKDMFAEYQRGVMMAADETQYYNSRRMMATVMVDLCILCKGCRQNGETTCGSVSRNCRGCRALEEKLGDYPLAPIAREVGLPEMSDVTLRCRALAGVATSTKKLILDNHPKQRYVLHLALLSLYARLGLYPVRFHSGIAYSQSPWMREWVEWCAEKRKCATDEFGKAHWKRAGLACFGKTFEDVRGRNRIVLVHTDEPTAAATLTRLMRQPSYTGCTRFGLGLIAVHMNKNKVLLNKCIPVGAAILDLSKAFMARHWYVHVKGEFGTRARLLATDTDSLLWSLETDTQGAYLKFMQRHAWLYDTSGYHSPHPLHSIENKKKLGTFKNECPVVETGKHHLASVLYEFCGLAPKCYSLRVLNEKDSVTAKGVAGVIRRGVLTFSDYFAALQEGAQPRFDAASFIRSDGHKVCVKEIQKKSIVNFTDKRFQLTGPGHRSLPYGHYDIERNGAWSKVMRELRINHFRGLSQPFR